MTLYRVSKNSLCFQDRSRRLDVTHRGQLSKCDRARQSSGRLSGLHDEGTTATALTRTFTVARHCRNTWSESSTGTRARFQIGVLLGGEENSTKKQMQDIIDFETQLAQITTPPEERRDEEKLYNLMTLSDLQRKAPFVRLSPLYSRLLGRSG